MPSLDALRPSPLVEQAAERIRGQIIAGEWPVGGKLPGETTLAGLLGVGRSTVREALRALTGEGLLQPRQGVGVFVIAAEPHQMAPSWLRQAAVSDLYEVRMMIEVQAVALAAKRRTEADVARLRAGLELRRSAAADADDAAFVDADITLHQAIIDAAHNSVLTDLFAAFRPAMRAGLIDLVALLGLRELDANHGDATHAALVDAIEQGKPEVAARTLRAELKQTARLLAGMGGSRRTPETRQDAHRERHHG